MSYEIFTIIMVFVLGAIIKRGLKLLKVSIRLRNTPYIIGDILYLMLVPITVGMIMSDYHWKGYALLVLFATASLVFDFIGFKRSMK